jgi:hypothetical protein
MSIRSSFSKSVHALLLGGALTVSLPLNAAMLDFWSSDGWSVLDAEDSVASNGYVGPGFGGQSFDAEYLFYKEDGDLISIGLQTGFDILDGEQDYLGQSYYAGDLALSFNGGDFDYAIDFGLLTKDKDGNDVGIGSGNQDAAGLYEVSAWNDNITFPVSSPFAMDEGSLAAGITTTAGVDGDSFFRTITLDLSELGFDVKTINAHWTMSCGNDALNGFTYVPEPTAMLLFAGGLFGLGAVRRRRNRV